MLDFLVNLWYHTCIKDKFMTDSTLDLFCDHIDSQLAEEYAMELESKASSLEITVDYLIEEFMIDGVIVEERTK
jgi:hypothetical protein